MIRKRFLRVAEGDDQAALEAGVVVFLQEVLIEGEGVIVVPELRTVKYSMLASFLKEKIGEKNADIFFRDRVIDLGEGKKIHLCSDRTLKNYRYADVYLALHSTKFTVEEIENLHSWKSLIWVTWSKDEHLEWEAKHKPKRI